LGFQPQFTFQEGIEKTVAWYQENYLNKWKNIRPKNL
jgi:dTDP-D-glucose 4,6-dehydratase